MHNIGASVIVAEPQFAETAQQVARAVDCRVAVLPELPVSTATLPTRGGPVAFYLHTSGTTGNPRPVPFTESVLSARTKVLSALTGIGPDHRYASGSPMHHIGGLGNLLVALSMGAALLPTTSFSREWWCAIGELRATHCMLVPSMIEMLLSADLMREVPLQTLIYGASPITPDTLRRVMQTLPDVGLVNLFGQTEGSPIASLDREDHRRAAAGAWELLHTVGRPVAGLQLRIDDPDAGGVGEIVAAAAHLSVRGWLHTGDLGWVDDAGYLHLAGRRHDMVIRGGENVYPLEVENVIASHPDVAAVGVVGVSDQRLGETLAAFVVPADLSSSLDFQQLEASSGPDLAGFKVPAYWYVVEGLPTNSAGKVLRTVLRQWHDDRREDPATLR